MTAAHVLSPQVSEDGLSFPVAKRADGTLVHISAHKGEDVVCMGCDAPMHARAGTERVRRHFAHKSLGVQCSRETVLHKVFKAAIAEAFAQAKTHGNALKLWWTCRECFNRRCINLAHWFDTVEVESSAIAGVRPDILLVGKRKSALEVVVSHRPERQTLERYKSAEVPVFELAASFGALEVLLGDRTIEAERCHFVRSSGCVHCKEKTEVSQRRRKTVMELDLSMLAKSQCSWKPWGQDAAGEWLALREREKAYKWAHILSEAKFEQSDRVPYLFTLSLPPRPLAVKILACVTPINESGCFFELQPLYLPTGLHKEDVALLVEYVEHLVGNGKLAWVVAKNGRRTEASVSDMSQAYSQEEQ